MRRVIIFSLMLVGIGFLLFSSRTNEPLLIYNRTDSAPIGWYKIHQKDAYEVGDVVAIRMPKKLASWTEQRGYLPPNAALIKTITASSGDVYCVKDSVLSLSSGQHFDILPFDSKGREMPAPANGCRRLSTGRFLVLSDRIAGSYDSRYFGAISKGQIIGSAVFLGADEVHSDGQVWEKGGARGRGAEGKIKEACTKLVPSLCLHIDFACTKIFGHAPSNFEIANGDG